MPIQSVENRSHVRRRGCDNGPRAAWLRRTYGAAVATTASVAVGSVCTIVILARTLSPAVRRMASPDDRRVLPVVPGDV
jgi:hypothetical protein